MDRIKLTIAQLRKEKGITQSELAEYLGVSFQSVSKWENGITNPDIELLPSLAEYFQVSVDEILGLKPFNNRKHVYQVTPDKEHWGRKIDYLKNSRIGFWNDDYFEFLVKKVWGIDKPIDIIDFGCGYGYLGLMFLSILPEGSTYTGIDISDKLLEEARSLFKNSGYKAQFIKGDISNLDIKDKYDLAICQAVLRHSPDPKNILSKMINSAAPGGIVACIEVNREFENSGLFIDGMSYEPGTTASVLQKVWKAELESGERDYSVGMKIPFYMQELGLHDIDVRVNDRVNFINPLGDKSKYYKLLDSTIAASNWDKPMPDSEKEDILSMFMGKGLKRAEVEKYIKAKSDICDFVSKNRNNAAILKTLCLLISYGIK